MVNSKIQVVQGFKVKDFASKKDVVELKLTLDKEELKAGEYDLGEVLGMLELHQTSDYTVELTLLKKSDTKGLD